MRQRYAAAGGLLLLGGFGLWTAQRRPDIAPARAARPAETQPVSEKQPPEPQQAAVHLVAVGDIMMDGAMGRLMAQKGRGYPFAATKPLLSGADIAFGNLECTIATVGKPIPKQFNFRARPETAQALTEAGFDIISLANNHAWDFGRAALLETVERVEAAGVATVGAGANREEAHALKIVERNGLKIGFLAYCGLFPALISESETEPSLAMGHPEAVKADVEAARDSVDFLLVSLHGGKEGHAQPSPLQRAIAQAAIDAGADMVIGHHPHVVQPLEWYKEKPICYSLGNFVFSVSGRGTGAMLDATLSPDGKIEARLRPLRLAGGQPHFPRARKRPQVAQSVRPGTARP